MADQLDSNRPPDILGPPQVEMCDFCDYEPAEHRVRLWSWAHTGPLKSWEFNLCGTCLAREQKEARMTYDELQRFSEDHKDRRFDDD